MIGHFSTASVYASLALAVLTAAKPSPDALATQCGTGTIQCCNSIQSAGSPDAIQQLGLVGVVVKDVGALVGFDCSINVFGGNSCDAQPACCTGETFSGGRVVLGCTPATSL